LISSQISCARSDPRMESAKQAVGSCIVPMAVNLRLHGIHARDNWRSAGRATPRIGIPNVHPTIFMLISPTPPSTFHQTAYLFEHRAVSPARLMHSNSETPPTNVHLPAERWRLGAASAPGPRAPADPVTSPATVGSSASILTGFGFIETRSRRPTFFPNTGTLETPNQRPPVVAESSACQNGPSYRLPRLHGHGGFRC